MSRYVAIMAVLAVVPFVSAARAGTPAAQAGPVRGGTLKIVAASGPDHLDPVPAYYTADYILERAYTRQLVSYRSVPDPSFTSAGWKTDITPVADAATEVPTVANGGITGGGTIYTFHIKVGVDWDTRPARQVTAPDFIREFKAFCNPAPGGFVGNLSYYTETIVGLTKYCDAETSYFAGHQISAASVAGFQNSHDISGLTAPNNSTLRFRLYRPASDFLYLLALPFASARPVEDDAYLPNSLGFDQHFLSDGPYRVTSYRPGRSIVLSRNPAWHQTTDPIRHQYASSIVVTMGVYNAQAQVDGLKTGNYDLMFDTAVPAGDVKGLKTSKDFHIWPSDFLLPYLVFNLRSPNAGHAIAKVDVRKAIEFAVDKAAVQKIQGGSSVAQIIDSPQTPGSDGYLAANPYPTPGNKGSVAKCKAELASGGVHGGLTLKYAYPEGQPDQAIFASVKASLAPCGIHLKGDPLPGSEFFVDLSDTSLTNKAGTFDLASPGWIPDWYGNNGRSILDPLFRTDCVENTINYGCYSDATTDKLMSEAEAATSAQRADALWTEAMKRIMADAAIVPLTAESQLTDASSRVREAGLPGGVVGLPNIGGPDITNIWLAKG